MSKTLRGSPIYSTFVFSKFRVFVIICLVFGILSFDIHLTFELWHLTFKLQYLLLAAPF